MRWPVFLLGESGESCLKDELAGEIKLGFA